MTAGKDRQPKGLRLRGVPYCSDLPDNAEPDRPPFSYIGCKHPTKGWFWFRLNTGSNISKHGLIGWPGKKPIMFQMATSSSPRPSRKLTPSLHASVMPSLHWQQPKPRTATVEDTSCSTSTTNQDTTVFCIRQMQMVEAT